MEPKRYPLQSLLDATGLAEHELSIRTGLKGTTLKRARDYGLLEAAADRYACRAGFVPWHVWPEWIADVIADCSVECDDENCDARFVPQRRNNRFCSHQCAKNNWARNRYQTDAAHRAACLAARVSYYEETSRAQRLKARVYYQENRDAVRARQAAYYQANRVELLAKQALRDRAKAAA